MAHHTHHTVAYRWNPYDRSNNVVIEASSSPPPASAFHPTPPISPFHDEATASQRWSTFESIPVVVQNPQDDASLRRRFSEMRRGSSSVAAPSRGLFRQHGSNSSFGRLSSQPSAVSTSLATTSSSGCDTEAGQWPSWRSLPSPTPTERFEAMQATFAPRPFPLCVPVPPAPIAPAVLSSLKRYPFFCDFESRHHQLLHGNPPGPLKPEPPRNTPPSSSSSSSRRSTSILERSPVVHAVRTGDAQPHAPHELGNHESPPPEESSSTTSFDAPRFRSTGYARRQRRLKLKIAMAQRRLEDHGASSTEPP